MNNKQMNSLSAIRTYHSAYIFKNKLYLSIHLSIIVFFLHFNRSFLVNSIFININW